ncbi:MAG TPA: zf-HC2 domain-containing protein [Bryobacteraceae bacterium]|nr:zf-HC2 domain-containing protein [Bryobacteraceae bacterium]
MSEHDTIREWMPLAAGGALDPQQQRRLEEHARVCAECRRELEVWSGYAQGLRQLPQPGLPAQLVERTRARVWQDRATAADRRWDELMLAALALFAWTVGLTFWFVLRIFTGGALVIMGANLVRFGTWSAVSTLFVWLTAAVAALALGRRRRELRRAI